MSCRPLEHFEFSRPREVARLLRQNGLCRMGERWFPFLALPLVAGGLCLGLITTWVWVQERLAGWSAASYPYLESVAPLLAGFCGLAVGLLTAAPGILLLVWAEEALPARRAANEQRIAALQSDHERLTRDYR